MPNACALGTLPTSARKPAGGEGAGPVPGLASPSWAGAALKALVQMQSSCTGPAPGTSWQAGGVSLVRAGGPCAPSPARQRWLLELED